MSDDIPEPENELALGIDTEVDEPGLDEPDADESDVFDGPPRISNADVSEPPHPVNWNRSLPRFSGHVLDVDHAAARVSV